MNNRAHTKLLVVMIVIGVGLVIGAVTFSHELRIRFHKWAMMLAWDGIVRESSEGSNRQSYYIDLFDYHQTALTSLGYFELDVFPLKHTAPGSDEWKALYHALNEAITNVSERYFLMRGYGSNVSREVVIWARPGERARFESMISKLDTLPKTESGSTSGVERSATPHAN
ncbi:MAG: hypothetical protein HY043_12255 [Verrucomicrobia bacterium]|nr:hypothetical protein [Verrucomicrobiota bacterium]